MNRLLFFALLLLASTAGYTDPAAVYLTWQRSPESTMTIHWLTLLDEPDDAVEYQPLGAADWLKTTGFHTQLPVDTPYFIHTVELTNLHPAADYSFRIGSAGHIYKFQTMPADLRAPIRFVAGGDMYHDSIEILRATNREAAKTSPMFALVGGDIAYAADKQANLFPSWMHRLLNVPLKQKFEWWLGWLVAWEKEMVTPEGRLVPILPVLGNHDTNGYFGQTPAEAPFFYSLFAMPGQQGYNVLDFGNYMSLVVWTAATRIRLMARKRSG